MSLTKKASTLFLFTLVPALAAGCGGGGTTAVPLGQVELTSIHEMYQHYIKSHKKAPSQLSDLTSKQYDGIYPGPVQALKKGKYVVVWGVNSKDSGTVLAYEKDAPEKGGAAVMADGTVRNITAEEAKAAQKS